VVGLQSIVARETKPGTPIVVSINAVQGGSAPNVVADDIVLRGNVRWFADADRDRVLERIPQIARAVCEAIRADVRFEITASAPVTVNSRSIVEAVADVARTSGVAPVDLGPLTASDDFAQYLASAPGALIGVGAGFAGAAPHHHGAFDIDERAIGVMTQLLARTALRVLSSSAAFTVGAVG
jgi:amidohydrolase